MRVKGKISQWDDDKGFGFIQPILKGERVFVHIKALQHRTRRPVAGEVVTYTLETDAKGRLQAQSVTFAGEKLVIKTAKTASNWPLWLVAIFVVLLLSGWAVGKLPLYMLLVYSLLSLLTFVIYWLDKRKAQAGRWRIQESRLQFLALLGGWPGALLAQAYLRHKSQKRAFLLVFWCAAVCNVVAISVLIGQGMPAIADFG